MKVPEEFRVITGPMASNSDFGNNGLFIIRKRKLIFEIIASDGLEWDHVSVVIKNRKRAPTWDEMCFIKDLFFGENECVIQYHPKKSDYVNFNNYCLHLWRPQGELIPKPSKIMV